MGKKKEKKKIEKAKLAKLEEELVKQREKAAQEDAERAKAQKALKDKGFGKGAPPAEVAAALRFTAGDTLAERATDDTPGFSGEESDVAKDTRSGQMLADLQEKLYAQSKTTGRSLLLVVQGMDTSGKGGVMRHVVGGMDPQGVQLTSFKAPTDAEKAEPFLARIRRALPAPGRVGVFDRSHYEDVLIVRVHNLVAPAVWRRRYATINSFEKSLLDKGTDVVKVMLNISADEQQRRLLRRIEREDKRWKYRPGDVDERAQWPAYQEAYQVALSRCSDVPWYVVPADNKWYAEWAVRQLLLHHLSSMDLQWPAAEFDIDAERQRVLASTID